MVVRVYSLIYFVVFTYSPALWVNILTVQAVQVKWYFNKLQGFHDVHSFSTRDDCLVNSCTSRLPNTKLDTFTVYVCGYLTLWKSLIRLDWLVQYFQPWCIKKTMVAKSIKILQNFWHVWIRLLVLHTMSQFICLFFWKIYSIISVQ